MDCNSIIYDCIRSIESDTNFENKLIKNVCLKIEEYINNIKPSNTVYIAFDGVAPVAKLEQQRTRRYKSGFTNEIINSFKNNKEKYWDTTNITPELILCINYLSISIIILVIQENIRFII